MRNSRASWIPLVVLIAALTFAGCGSTDNGPSVATTTIISEVGVDADVSRDLSTNALSLPSLASSTGYVLSGVTFTPPSGASLLDTRGFLYFPLGTVPVGATVQYAGLSICLAQLTLSNPTAPAGAPFFLDLIDTTVFPPPVQSSDYAAPYLASRSFSFISGDQGNCVEIEVTSLMNQAQFLVLPSFMVRLGFDDETYQKDLNTTRGLVQVHDSVVETAPLLIVDYL